MGYGLCTVNVLAYNVIILENSPCGGPQAACGRRPARERRPSEASAPLLQPGSCPASLGLAGLCPVRGKDPSSPRPLLPSVLSEQRRIKPGHHPRRPKTDLTLEIPSATRRGAQRRGTGQCRWPVQHRRAGGSVWKALGRLAACSFLFISPSTGATGGVRQRTALRRLSHGLGSGGQVGGAGAGPRAADGVIPQ